MLDTIKLAFRLDSVPSPDDLISLGWNPLFNKYTGKVKSLYYKEGNESGVPYLSIYRALGGVTYLTVEVSLPAFLFGSNVRLPNESEAVEGIENLCIYAGLKSGIDIDPQAVQVWEVHFTKDFHFDQPSIIGKVSQLSGMRIPYFDRGRYSDSTLYFHSKGAANGKKKPRTIAIYGKHAECVKKKRKQADVESAEGKLRLEFRYGRRTAVKDLLESLKLDCSAGEVSALIRNAVSQSVLEPVENQIRLTLGESAGTDPIKVLTDKYGARRAKSLIAFLTYRDRYGDDFFKLDHIRYPRSAYYSCARDCRKVGINTLNNASHFNPTLD